MPHSKFGWDYPPGVSAKDIEDFACASDEDVTEVEDEVLPEVVTCESCGGEGHYMYQPEQGQAYDAICWVCGGSGKVIE